MREREKKNPLTSFHKREPAVKMPFSEDMQMRVEKRGSSAGSVASLASGCITPETELEAARLASYIRIYCLADRPVEKDS